MSPAPPSGRAASNGLATQAANLALLARWQARSACWLVAGDLRGDAPALVLDAFALYLTHCESDARLLVLASGGEPPLALGQALQESPAAARIELHAATPAVLKAALLAADGLLVCAAAHDPAITLAALELGVPVLGGIVASSVTGTAALLWDEEQAPLLAASMERLRRDERLRELLRTRGRRRFDALHGGAERPA